MFALVVFGYAAVTRVSFELPHAYVSGRAARVLSDALFLPPLEYVPLLVCVAGFLSVVPEILSRERGIASERSRS